MKTYTKKDILRLIPRLKPNQIKYYVEQGVISPIKETEGTGHYRQFSEENLIEFAIIRELIGYKFPSSAVNAIMRAVRGISDEFEGLADLARIKEFEVVIFLQPSDSGEYFVMRYLCSRDKNGNISVGNESLHFENVSIFLVNVTQAVKRYIKE